MYPFIDKLEIYIGFEKYQKLLLFYGILLGAISV